MISELDENVGGALRDGDLNRGRTRRVAHDVADNVGQYLLKSIAIGLNPHGLREFLRVKALNFNLTGWVKSRQIETSIAQHSDNVDVNDF